MTIGSKKRLQLMLHYIDIGPSDVLLDVGGNTGKITEVYARDCKEIVILEPKHALVEYGRTYRPNIKFVQGGVENIPLPSENFLYRPGCNVPSIRSAGGIYYSHYS